MRLSKSFKADFEAFYAAVQHAEREHAQIEASISKTVERMSECGLSSKTSQRMIAEIGALNSDIAKRMIEESGLLASVARQREAEADLLASMAWRQPLPMPPLYREPRLKKRSIVRREVTRRIGFNRSQTP